MVYELYLDKAFFFNVLQIHFKVKSQRPLSSSLLSPFSRGCEQLIISWIICSIFFLGIDSMYSVYLLHRADCSFYLLHLEPFIYLSLNDCAIFHCTYPLLNAHSSGFRFLLLENDARNTSVYILLHSCAGISVQCLQVNLQIFFLASLVPSEKATTLICVG